MAAKLKIEGATILITGASSGIGAELARQLAPRAGTLILVARRGDRLRELQAALSRDSSVRVSVYECDLADLAATERLASRIESEVGAVDVLINNAGMGDFAFYARSSWQKVEQMLRLNVLAPAYLTRRFLAGMIARGRGGILNVSSLAGFFVFPGLSPYVGTKHFVTGFTESLHAEVGASPVVISQLCPGPVSTEFEAAAAGGMPTKIPGWMNLSAETCARQAIRGFERGRAVIIPGFAARVFATVMSIAPLMIRRRIARVLARALRRQNLMGRPS